eukprot:TRINITY_DN24830_c0_g2_i1.p1 TRINITY_DN24830_c0_g2~~TRINITY_DN24830_c0_g2_i1.p1  ORF type:complete len:397 (-),score=49.90 TRINITY_DN24830_c0_g2_i1:454-1644(-)
MASLVKQIFDLFGVAECCCKEDGVCQELIVQAQMSDPVQPRMWDAVPSHAIHPQHSTYAQPQVLDAPQFGGVRRPAGHGVPGPVPSHGELQGPATPQRCGFQAEQGQGAFQDPTGSHVASQGLPEQRMQRPVAQVSAFSQEGGAAVFHGAEQLLSEHDLVEKPAVSTEEGTYTGQWLGIQRHGRGTLVRPDGSYYEGEFRYGMAHGRGKLNVINGESYDGEWVQDRAEGFGKYTHEDGSFYEGQWNEDEKHGQGLERFSDGSCYEGSFSRGNKHGMGMYRANTGQLVFQGQFQNDTLGGDGSYNFPDGRFYMGQFMSGQMEGQGIMTWPDGSSYEGTFQGDKRHGAGYMSWPETGSWQGQWHQGKQHGEGVLTDVNGRSTHGRWHHGAAVMSSGAR